MIGKILLLATVAVAQARHIDVETGRAMIEHELCADRIHYLLPHEWDCTKFYYCEYGLKWEAPRDCSPGTEFSYELQVCVHPASANCQLSNVPPSPEEESNETETEVPSTEAATIATQAPTTEVPSTEAAVIVTQAPTTEVPSTEAAVIVTQAPTTEVPSTEAAVIVTQAPTTEVPSTEAAVIVTQAPTTEVPSTEAAVIVTQAPTTEVPSTEAAVIVTQAPTTEVPSTEAAVIVTQAPTTEVPSTEAAVIVTQAPTTEAPSTEAAISTEAAPTPEPDQTIPTEAPESELLPNGCPADFDVHLLLPHETRCDKFYYCVFGEKVERSCASGTHFDPVQQACDWPENVDCVNTDVSSEYPEENNSEEDLEGSGDPEIDVDEEVLPNGCPADFDVHKLLPHETDCSKFYYCVFGEKVERQCGENTLFNPEEQVCDWPENVNCANSGNSGEDNGNNGNSGENNGDSGENNGNGEENGTLENGCPSDWDVHQLLPHETECSKFYYCVFGEKVERDCSPGTHFNPVLQVCDHPQNAGCANSGENGNSGEDDNGSGDNGSGDETDNGDGDNGNSEEDNGTLDNGCPADWNVHLLLPHEKDCDKFYYCVHGQKVERNCAPGTHFDPVLQVCDWPENVNCANSGNSGEDNGNNGNSGENNGDSGENNGNGEENGTLENGCPSDWDVHQLLPHETECSKFYYCVFGEKVERDCSPGTHFNPVLQVCDHPQNAGCANSGDNGNSGEDDNGSGDNGSGDETDNGDGDNGNSEEDNGTLDNGCPADWNVHLLLPHEKDCDKFYYCVHGQKVERNCAPGTHFDPILQVCDWPENVNCANSGNSGEDNGNNGNSGENNGDSGENNGNGEENGTLENGCPSDWDVHQLLPHETECSKFYYCVFGEKVERDCSPGTHFNPVLQVCDTPDNAGCANAGSDENGNSGENGNGGENGNSGENGASGENNESDKCKASCNVPAWAHEHDCDKFWRCDGENAVLGTCSEGLHFNVNTQTCDFICNAGCVRDDVQSTPEHDGLKLFLPWNKVDGTIRKRYLGHK